MNYYTFEPNCYSNTLNTPNLLYTPSLSLSQPVPTKIEYVTSILRQALRISVNNYAANFYNKAQPNSQTTNNSPQSHNQQPIRHQELQMLLEQEENKQNLKLSDPIDPNTALNLTPSNEKTTLSPQLQLTDDELLSKQAANAIPSAKEKSSKKRRNNDSSHFKVIVPEVDLIETAYIAALPMQASQLTVLRNKLLLRQVNEMGDFCKGRRDKREIRMLAN